MIAPTSDARTTPVSRTSARRDAAPAATPERPQETKAAPATDRGDGVEMSDAARAALNESHPDPNDARSATQPQDQPLTDTQANQVLYDNFATFDTAAKGGNGDNRVSRGDIEAVANDPNASPELREAAQHILDQQDQFRDLDSGRRGYYDEYAGQVWDTDGRISREDVGDVLSQDYAGELGQNFDQVAGGDGNSNTITRSDLMTAAQSDDPDVAAAARFYLAQSQYFAHADTAGSPVYGNTNADQQIGSNDLEEVRDGFTIRDRRQLLGGYT